jgi:hypothetical protein
MVRSGPLPGCYRMKLATRGALSYNKLAKENHPYPCNSDSAGLVCNEIRKGFPTIEYSRNR